MSNKDFGNHQNTVTTLLNSLIKQGSRVGTSTRDDVLETAPGPTCRLV